MKYFQLPQTNLNVSRIALGCMRIADKSVDEVDDLIKTSLIMLIFMVEENLKRFLVRF